VRTCTACLKAKPTEDYYRRSGGYLRGECKPCSRTKYPTKNDPEYQAAYREAHREEAKEYAKTYNAKLTATGTRPKLSPEAKARKVQSTGRWQKANKGRVNAQNKAYKVAKINRTPPWLTKEHLAVMTEVYETAAMLSTDECRYEVDHILPLRGENVSGLHVPWNLQILTREENARKNNKVL
jgi:5-methylcytosine-specific restriction endonuclease McrA